MHAPRNPHFLEEDDLLQLLEQIEEQGQADWELFLTYADKFTVSRGNVLIRQLDSDRVIYILTEGELEVRVGATPDGPQRVVATVRPVAIVGEQTFLDGQPRTASIAVKTKATVHRLTLSAFDKLRAEEPELACAFLFDVARALSLRLRHVPEQQAPAEPEKPAKTKKPTK